MKKVGQAVSEPIGYQKITLHLEPLHCMSTVKAITSSVTTSVFRPVEALHGKCFGGDYVRVPVEYFQVLVSAFF